MPKRAEMLAEELVYEVAEELGLTETEVLRLDAIALVDGALRSLRVELTKQAGRPLTAGDYGLPDPRPANVVDLRRSLEDPSKPERELSSPGTVALISRDLSLVTCPSRP